jgi:hypothetical protein
MGPAHMLGDEPCLLRRWAEGPVPPAGSDLGPHAGHMSGTGSAGEAWGRGVVDLPVQPALDRHHPVDGTGQLLKGPCLAAAMEPPAEADHARPGPPTASTARLGQIATPGEK